MINLTKFECLFETSAFIKVIISFSFLIVPMVFQQLIMLQSIIKC